MNILVINAGSSSIKYQLIEMPSTTVMCSGLVERIGLEDSVITHKTYNTGEEVKTKKVLNLPDHSAGLNEVNALLVAEGIAVIKNTDEINAVGHRVVHGGEKFAKTALITSEVKDEIKKLFPLAPLHNPANLLGIEVAEKIFTKAEQIAVFDTAFHQTMPEVAFRYAIPSKYYKDFGVRAYGFHGTSHKFVSEEAVKFINKPDAKVITVHLGNGCSIAAVQNGKCFDTSMGLGPMNGLIMGTRSGDIDQSVVFHLVNQLGYSVEQVNNLLNKQSGMQGLTGFSDMRDITDELEKGNHDAKLAYDMYAYRIRKYIGSYIAVLGGVDTIVFTAGVGENDSLCRQLVCEGLTCFGVKFDVEANKIRSGNIRPISTPESTIKVLVVPTNEELEIARQCKTLLG